MSDLSLIFNRFAVVFMAMLSPALLSAEEAEKADKQKPTDKKLDIEITIVGENELPSDIANRIELPFLIPGQQTDKQSEKSNNKNNQSNGNAQNALQNNQAEQAINRNSVGVEARNQARESVKDKLSGKENGPPSLPPGLDPDFKKGNGNGNGNGGGNPNRPSPPKKDG